MEQRDDSRHADLNQGQTAAASPVDGGQTEASPLPVGAVCPDCGYDLRGLTGDRCPECGFDLNVVRTQTPQIPQFPQF